MVISFGNPKPTINPLFIEMALKIKKVYRKKTKKGPKIKRLQLSAGVECSIERFPENRFIEVADRVMTMFMLAGIVGEIKISMISGVPTKRGQSLKDKRIFIWGKLNKSLRLFLKLQGHREKIEILISSKEHDMEEIEKSLLEHLHLERSKTFYQHKMQRRVSSEFDKIMEHVALPDHDSDVSVPVPAKPNQPEECREGKAEEGPEMLQSILLLLSLERFQSMKAEPEIEKKKDDVDTANLPSHPATGIEIKTLDPEALLSLATQQVEFIDQATGEGAVDSLLDIIKEIKRWGYDSERGGYVRS
ncbi:hypothetical protein N9L18_00435 [Candidatus Pacebacteria bacterium]|nr:hypothetical protein [Candidatus Paceibacterota bacterium]